MCDKTCARHVLVLSLCLSPARTAGPLCVGALCVPCGIREDVRDRMPGTLPPSTILGMHIHIKCTQQLLIAKSLEQPASACGRHLSGWCQRGLLQTATSKTRL